MNKVEKLHSQNHGLYTSYSVKNKEGKFETVTSVKAAAEITKQIAIEFGAYLFSKDCQDLVHDLRIVGEDYSINTLFQKFLKIKQ